MINYDYLVKQLRQLNIKLADIAADEIEKLERIAQKQSDNLNVLRGSIANYQVGVHEDRIAELEAALKPFADVADELGTDSLRYRGIDITVAVADLRQARKVLGEKK